MLLLLLHSNAVGVSLLRLAFTVILSTSCSSKGNTLAQLCSALPILQIVLKDGACTPLPKFSKALTAVLERVTPAMSRLFNQVGLLADGASGYQDLAANGGVAALVEFDTGSKDIFTLHFRKITKNINAPCGDETLNVRTGQADLFEITLFAWYYEFCSSS